MEPESLDEFCQRKLAQLSQVPDLDWEEEKVWQKIQRQLKGSSFPFRYLFVLLLVVSTLGWYTLSRSHKLLVPDRPRTQAPAKQSIAERDKTKPSVNQLNLPESRAQVVEKAFPRPATVDPTKPLSMVEPLPSTPMLPETKLPAASLPKTLPRGMPQQEQARTALRDTTATVQENRSSTVQGNHSGSKKQKEQERYLASAGNGLVTGIRQVWPVSRRLSLVHGLQIMQPYAASLPLEMSTEFSLDYALQFPLEVRYYLTPKDKRFTVFLYGSLLPSLAFSQPVSLVSRRPVGLSFQAGVEARYRLFTTKQGSSAFFFMRLPAYQRSLLPVAPSPRGHSLWGGGTF